LQAAAMDINKVIQLLDDEEDYGDWDDDIICNGSDDDLCIDDDDVCTSDNEINEDEHVSTK
jgi:hypothetical protein